MASEKAATILRKRETPFSDEEIRKMPESDARGLGFTTSTQVYATLKSNQSFLRFVLLALQILIKKD